MFHESSSLPFIMFLMACLTFTSCKDSSSVTVKEFKIPQSHYSVGKGMESGIFIISGNRDYTLTAEDPDIIEFEYNPEYSDHGSIRITGLKKGKTILTIKDNISGDSEQVNITVTDPNLIFLIESVFAEVETDDPDQKKDIQATVLQNNRLKYERIFGLVESEEKSAIYLFDNEKALEDETPSRDGTYRLILNDDNNQAIEITFTDEQENEVSVYSIDLISNTLQELFSADQKEKSNRKPTSQGSEHIDLQETSPVYDVLHLSELVTEKYTSDFPALNKAVIHISAVPLHPQQARLPEDLVY